MLVWRIFTQDMNKYPDWAITYTDENNKISREFLNMADEIDISADYFEEPRQELMAYHGIFKFYITRDDIVTGFKSLYSTSRKL